jgi:hypothetical protein
MRGHREKLKVENFRLRRNKATADLRYATRKLKSRQEKRKLKRAYGKLADCSSRSVSGIGAGLTEVNEEDP